MNGMNTPEGRLFYCRPHLILSLLVSFLLVVKGFKKKTPAELPGSQGVEVMNRNDF
jgi:hypothetical protein